ncbi:MAG TPA: hypothetical protein VFY65_12890, partial [Longimicrobium sp.]|nr:hypothetical protein [Longimicrobium sp.]
VYKTDQMAFADRTRVLYEVRDGPPVRTVIARLNEGRGGENGARFYEHLAGARGAEVFRKHGFDPLPAAAP